MYPRDQTIFALSSGRPPSAISIVRVSGTRTAEILAGLTGKLPPQRLASRALLRDKDRQPIDDAIVLWFPGPASATGEDVAEFHVHGGRAVVSALLGALATFENARAAEPGEFTRRAFENGKLDLTEAEALDDLIHADTEQQRRRALRQLQGALGDKARSWRARIIEACALIEAGIDFSDEVDVPKELLEQARARIEPLLAEIEEVLAAQGRGERLRDGLVVAIAGPPNVGKSTLMNRLARREIAIVSPHAGTTRDVIEVQLDLEGYPVTVMDTAGIRETADPVEQEGVRRAQTRAAEADLVLWLVDDDTAGELVGGLVPVWMVRNKVDLNAVCSQKAEIRPNRENPEFAISAVRGDGMDQLLSALVGYARNYFGLVEQELIGRARHRKLLHNVSEILRCSITSAGFGEEILAEELRRAAHSLGQLLGRIDVEDVLDEIFRNFCIGK